MSSIWTIRRSATDSKLAGLCGGIAQHWGIDPTLVRVGAVLLALSGGLGLAIYAAGWLFIPVAGQERSKADDVFGEKMKTWPKEVWVILFVISCIVVMSVIGPMIPFGAAPAIVFAAVWYFGYYRNRSKNQSEQTPTQQVGPVPPPAPPTQFVSYSGPPTPFTDAAQAWQQRIADHQQKAAQQNIPSPQPQAAPSAGVTSAGVTSAGVTSADMTSADMTSADMTSADMTSADMTNEPVGLASEFGSHNSYPTAGERAAFLATPDPAGIYAEPVLEVAPKPNRARTRSARRLRLVSLIVLGLTLGGLALADVTGLYAASLVVYLSAALLVVALTLVAAAWFGRARGILPVALLLTLATLGTGAHQEFEHWGGSQTLHYASIADLPSGTQHFDNGSVVLDLSDLEVTTATTYNVHLDAGSMTIKLPENANVVVKWSVDTGTYIEPNAALEAGRDLSGEVSRLDGPPGAPQLILQPSVDRGSLLVK